MEEKPESPSGTSTQQHEATDIDTIQASSPFVGDWNRLVSRTNWEKGRIIFEWREALEQSGARPVEYSDESWSQLVGGVTGQHVGRLRRVYQRFGSTCDQYEKLVWSHFHAAMDWDDAEMWLEGAVQSKWSVAQMRAQRSETLGDVDQSSDLLAASEEAMDEDVDETVENQQVGGAIPETISGVVQQFDADPDSSAPSPRSGRVSQSPSADEAASQNGGPEIYAEDDGETIEFVRPFENLGQLPDDLAGAFEEFKLVILRHKTEDWRQISRDDLLAALDALKELALAPASDVPQF